MEKRWRLILDDKGDGYYNMAVDEAILLKYPSHKIPTLRIYGWNRPFISLGYNQNPEEVLYLETGIPFVRRITGGSAILHDKEITYSLTCSFKDLDLPEGVKESYQKICSFLKCFYWQLGLKAHFAKDVFSENLGRYKNFCFSTWQHFDLLIDRKKIGGNAQRRKKDIIFQQGSIPQEIDFSLVRSSIKMAEDSLEKAASLGEILKNKNPLDFFSLSSLLADSFRQVFEIEFTKDTLFLEERETVNCLLERKYRLRSWNVCKKTSLVG